MPFRKVVTVLLLAAVLPVRAQAVLKQPPLGAISITVEQIRQAGIVSRRIDTGGPGPVQGMALRLQGTAVLPNQAIEVVSAPLAGVVQAVLVNPMQTVRRGQPIARISSPQLLEWQRDFVQAEAQAGLAIEKLKRDEALFVDGLISQSRLQDTRNAHTIAVTTARERRQSMQLAGVSDPVLRQLANSRELFPDLTVRAQHAGQVVEQTVAPGQRVEMGAPLVKLVDTRLLWVDLQATRAQGQLVRVGDVVQVAGCKKPGRISEVGVVVSLTAQTVAMRATVPEAGQCLRLNQYVDATVISQANAGNAVSVPAEALARNGGRDFVFVRTPAGFAPTVVSVLSRDTAFAQISADLPPSTEIAVQGIAALKGAWLGMGVTEVAPITPAQQK